MTTASRSSVTVVDYGMGNLFSIRRAVEHVGGACTFASTSKDVLAAERLILPGVGAFGDAMENLRSAGLDEAIREVAARGTPTLGICLGMQLLLSGSEEFGVHEGLGIVPGRVVRFPGPEPGSERYKIPHVGWARVLAPEAAEDDEGGCAAAEASWRGSVLEGVEHGSWAYFVHSLYAVPDLGEHVLAESVYGGRRFCSAMRCGRVFGCQYHPEMSGEAGLAVYTNFLGRDADAQVA